MYSLTKFVPSPNSKTRTYNIICAGNQLQPRDKNAPPRRVSLLDTTLSASLIPRPSHLGLRIRDRPRRQKLLHHRRIPCRRSPMQRRAVILRRASALCQAHPLSAHEIAPPPTPLTRCITKPRQGQTAMERDNSLAAKSRCPEKLG